MPRVKNILNKIGTTSAIIVYYAPVILFVYSYVLYVIMGIVGYTVMCYGDRRLYSYVGYVGYVEYVEEPDRKRDHVRTRIGAEMGLFVDKKQTGIRSVSAPESDQK